MQMKTILPTRSFAFGVLFLGLCIVLSGCSGKKQRTGLSGTVKKGDTPVTGYRLKLTTADGKTFDGPIAEDGKFALVDIPFDGEATVSLTPIKMPMAYTPSRDQPKKDFTAPQVPGGAPTQVPVDRKFLDPKTSGIKVTIEKDKNVEQNITVQ
jgi:hypothetical protein